MSVEVACARRRWQSWIALAVAAFIGFHDSTARSQAIVTEVEPNNLPAEASPVSAQGTLTGSLGEKDTDHAVFTVDRPGRLWRIQVVGTGARKLALLDSGGGEIAQASPIDGRILRLTNLKLPPGEHRVAIIGNSGEWVLRVLSFEPRPADAPPLPAATARAADEAEAIAAAPVTDEIEPNDRGALAMRLPFGRALTGQQADADDPDFWRFFLPGRQRLAVTVETREKTPLRVDLLWGNDNWPSATAFTPGGDTNRLDWDLLLPEGDYFLRIKGEKASLEPYAVEIARRSWFDRPSDMEPNNVWHQAVPVPSTGIISGTLYRNDQDWYRLTGGSQPRGFTLTAKDPEKAAGISVQALVEVPAPADQPWPDRKTARVNTKGDLRAGLTGTIPAGADVLLGIGGRAPDYTLTLATDPPASPAPPLPGVAAALELEAASVAAFVERRQRIRGRLTLSHDGTTPLMLALRAHASDALWTLDVTDEPVTVAPGQRLELPITVAVPPDARSDQDVVLEIAGFSPGFEAHPYAFKVAAAVRPAVEAPILDAGQAWPVPDALLGGVNLAWNSLGARMVSGRAELIDGAPDGGGAISLRADAARRERLVIELAGQRRSALAGVILTLPATTNPDTWLRRFAIALSDDGTSFKTVLEAALQPRAAPQPFLLPAGSAARFVRLDLIDSHGDDGRQPGVSIGELSVIGAAGETAPNEARLISRPDLGGHVVYTNPHTDGTALLEPGTKGSAVLTLPAGWTGPADLVFGFLGNRAAQIETISWLSPPDKPMDAGIYRLEYAVAVDSPFGPWTTIGAWDRSGLVQPPGSAPGDVRLARPAWGRYLRLRLTPRAAERPAKRALALFGTIEIRERAAGEGYRSILGQWSERTRDAILELVQPVPAPVADTRQDDSRDAAFPIPADQPARGTVERGRDVDYLRLDVPPDGRQVVLTLRRTPGLVPVLTLEGTDGAPIPFSEVKEDENGRHHRATVAAGPHFVRVEEPARSIVIAWDTSGSVRRSLDAIFQAVRRFATALSPGLEEVNFIPYAREPVPLLSQWAGRVEDAEAVIHVYTRIRESSSDSDTAMLAMAHALAPRKGVRAGILVTDAEYSSGKRDRVWQGWGAIRPTLFALQIPGARKGADALVTANRMQDWAFMSGGFHQRFATIGDADIAFDRLAAWLRRPKPYAVTASIDTTPPVPGQLKVLAPIPNLVAAGTVEVVMDASGSMLARVGRERRIDVAKRVLEGMVGQTLPEGAGFALRVFGKGEPGNCNTDLVVPPGEMDRAKVLPLIRGLTPVNLAKTPIGASLRAIRQDLAQAAAPHLVILLTDGEETCGGDAEAEIEALRAQGLDLRVSIIGFALEDPKLAELFKGWAALGGGQYFDARDGDSLRKALLAAITPRFEVKRGEEVVATGVIGDTALSLPPGEYEVGLISLQTLAPLRVNIAANQVSTVTFRQ